MGQPSAKNRYLTLAGAPWSPDNPANTLTLPNIFAGAASCLLVFGILHTDLADKQDDKTLPLLLTVGMTAWSIHSARKGRLLEAGQLSEHFEQLAIDTDPDNKTPPTSADMMGRIDQLLVTYTALWPPKERTLTGATVSTLFTIGGAITVPLLETAYPAVLLVPGGLIAMTDYIDRTRQLRKLYSRDWAITDRGDAVGNLQREEEADLRRSGDMIRDHVPPRRSPQ